jgi:hypothetical protein
VAVGTLAFAPDWHAAIMTLLALLTLWAVTEFAAAIGHQDRR